MLSEHPDVQQRNISQHLQLRDAGQVLHSVLVVRLVLSVHGHPEVLRVAHDDHLQRDKTRHGHTKHSDRHRSRRYLEVLPGAEREALEVLLLRAPALRQEGVPDEDSFLQTGVQMKSDVAAARLLEIHGEAERNGSHEAFVSARPGSEPAGGRPT